MQLILLIAMILILLYAIIHVIIPILVLAVSICLALAISFPLSSLLFRFFKWHYNKFGPKDVRRKITYYFIEEKKDGVWTPRTNEGNLFTIYREFSIAEEIVKNSIEELRVNYVLL
jgi:hypothetical protein